MQSFMASSQLRASAHKCCEQFKLLIEISDEIGSTDDAVEDAYNVGWIKDQFARFKMWAGNIGAFADGHASLDYRLRDNEKTKGFMLDFLTDLADFVHRGEFSICCLPDSFFVAIVGNEHFALVTTLRELSIFFRLKDQDRND